MYLVAIAWIYVTLMMAVAEATNTNGTVLGAIVTFLMYGLAPVALVIYVMGAPARSKAIKAREKAEQAAHAKKMAAAANASTNASASAEPMADREPSIEPDAGSEAAAAAPDNAIAPVRKEP